MFSDLDDERNESSETEDQRSDLLLILLKTFATLHYLLHLIGLLAFIIGDVVAATFAIISTWIIIRYTKIFSLNAEETKSLDS